ncbi:MAG: c-type cytochrome [Halothiobacillaceae bacterium]|jgi:cytochrome c|nr:c-type cytochrome [Halothiobacillaceae bacterium]
MFKLSAVAGTLLLAGTAAVAAPKVQGIGNAISDADIKPWDISVFFDGENLPAGQGSVKEGEPIYQAKCAMCHGEFGEGARGYPKMLGGTMEEFHHAAQHGEDNVGIRGVNNMWGHAPTLYDYIRRAMPFFAPQSLNDNESYATTCYVLYLAEVIDDEKTVCNADVLKKIKMPAQDNYVTDNRPDTNSKRCMKDCYQGEPVVKGMAVIGDVAVGAVKKRNEAEEGKPAGH